MERPGWEEHPLFSGCLVRSLTPITLTTTPRHQSRPGMCWPDAVPFHLCVVCPCRKPRPPHRPYNRVRICRNRFKIGLITTVKTGRSGRRENVAPPAPPSPCGSAWWRLSLPLLPHCGMIPALTGTPCLTSAGGGGPELFQFPSPYTGPWGTFGEAQQGAPWLTFLQSPWLRTRLRAEVDGETWGPHRPLGGSEGAWDPEGAC